MEPESKFAGQNDKTGQNGNPQDHISPILGLDSPLPGREPENASAHSQIRQMDGEMDAADGLSVNLFIARAHDARMKEIERNLSAAWSEMAEIAVQVRDNEEYLLLGFSSFGSWLLDAVPRSRSTVYAAIGLLEELKDVPMEDLRLMSVGCAHVLKKLDKASRTRQDVLEAAKSQPPSDFAATVSETVPTSLVEPYVNPRFRFTLSQWQSIQEGIQSMMEQDPDIKSREEAIEYIVEEWKQQ